MYVMYSFCVYHYCSSCLLCLCCSVLVPCKCALAAPSRVVCLALRYSSALATASVLVNHRAALQVHQAALHAAFVTQATIR